MAQCRVRGAERFAAGHQERGPAEVDRLHVQAIHAVLAGPTARPGGARCCPQAVAASTLFHPPHRLRAGLAGADVAQLEVAKQRAARVRPVAQKRFYWRA